ncbi:restriction endonuclease subunit S [Escherichia coli]|uniref:restriction endonuclease subunit S n=1 Tax=Escherichia coli TaxID=562 RepID=UPI0015D7D2B1|nr:restriction endonuclease subunit S [Escherichia coli]EEZ6067310.1 restriction endonuclease subunit S [Escherichia coli O121]EFO4321188.1 restriction endonuclease subunit S [Escherichia coli]EJE0229298.1 restriction endonuclease subunit S [Escherichia coli]NZB52093.1 restriction endonuclease subunit S [Escherichia coli]NZB56754.1 restriction endonuclease subunit S [Escherichia coli]
MVPKGWTLGTLKDLADTIMGYAFRSEDFVPTGIPLLRMGNLYQNTLDLNRNPVYLPDSFKVDYKRFLVSPGDLVMSMTGTMGKRDYGFTVEIPSNTQCSLLNQRVLKIVPKNNASSGYILNLLRSELILSVLYSFPGGTKQANLSAKQLQELPVLIPPELEQKKIAQILSTWDKAISVTEKLLTNSQRQKKALMQQLLTGNKRLLDENGVRFNGKWEKKLLSDVADVYQPKTISQSMMSDSGYPVYGANGVIGFYQEFNHETEQIAVTCRGSTCGIVNWTQAKSWITGNAMVINTDNYSYVSKKFLFYTLNGSDLKYLISGSGQPQITGNIKTHIINLPCIEEQQKIATVLSAADAEIYTLEKKLACLRDEKKALMQQLLTGKRRVKVDEAVAE